MIYEKKYCALDEHIDIQGIMDGLYYPFYMEECRHGYLNDVLGFNLEECAKAGVNIVLVEYTLKFKRPLVKGDEFTVDCRVINELSKKSRFQLHQRIKKDGKIMTEGIFTATFLNVDGGRPYVPEELWRNVDEVEPLEPHSDVAGEL